MKVTVDDDLCRGHGVCAAVCPQVFTLTDGGYAEATLADVPADLEPAVAEAVASCPEHAILTR
ncbi:ferredoxin [Mycolicibacterium vaccae]|uniref:Ferredoxin n=1 Tax=Mycolicibacterium vaccae ATCC 25954 TaxID=1194972 RepID=K0UWH6_MYCVA|nr:ferredoxin [Mycolicibacterium vaccae]ANI37344.1 ferredoxin [Mycolicibacterium vaccae 95051]EJZ11452.1 4Fe-4S ferredoxin [Mycolicibacterium vaccae ATCC 25954]MCV7064222.1 ferredoxin [Mycolicibacterium vaccae]